MRSFTIAVKGMIYQVSELNRKSGLYEIGCDGVFHTIGKSSKSNAWLYIRKAAFAPFIPFSEITSILELMIINKIQERSSVRRTDTRF